MNSTVGGSRMRSVRRGLCISVGSDLICSPVLGTPGPSVCLCWGRGLDFQGLLALLRDFPDSHANLGQAVCFSERGNIVCSPAVVQRPGGHWEGLTNGPKGNNLAESGLGGESHAISWDPQLSRTSRGSAALCWEPRPACVGGTVTYRSHHLMPSS